MEDESYFEIRDIQNRQKLLIIILQKFHEICERNGLVYNIFGGTMIGAIRHQGIIPWDDDIDVTMPRDDYNKLIELFTSFEDEDLEIFVYPRKNYIYPYVKLGLKGTILRENDVKNKYNILSQNIDVFPVDGYPQDENIFEKYNINESYIILQTYNNKIPKHVREIIYYVTKKIISYRRPFQSYVKEQIECFGKTSVQNSEFLICQGAGWGKVGKIRKEIYFDRVLYQFNDIKVWGIRDYDEHLRNLYGDYMTPPPIEKQCCPHSSSVYISKKIYDKYFGSCEI